MCACFIFNSCPYLFCFMRFLSYLCCSCSIFSLIHAEIAKTDNGMSSCSFVQRYAVDETADNKVCGISRVTRSWWGYCSEKISVDKSNHGGKGKMCPLDFRVNGSLAGCIEATEEQTCSGVLLDYPQTNTVHICLAVTFIVSHLGAVITGEQWGHCEGAAWYQVEWPI